jgi:hypothetical protein
MNEEFVKNCFIELMDNVGIPKSYYCLNGYQEEAACITKQENKWIVFEGERAIKYNIKQFENIKDACIDIIKRIAKSNDDYLYLKENFEKTLLTKKSTTTT